MVQMKGWTSTSSCTCVPAVADRHATIVDASQRRHHHRLSSPCSTLGPVPKEKARTQRHRKDARDRFVVACRDVWVAVVSDADGLQDSGRLACLGHGIGCRGSRGMGTHHRLPPPWRPCTQQCGMAPATIASGALATACGRLARRACDVKLSHTCLWGRFDRHSTRSHHAGERFLAYSSPDLPLVTCSQVHSLDTKSWQCPATSITRSC